MRDEIRHPVSLPITYILDDEEEKHVDTLKNISEGGLGLLVHDVIDIGEEIEITLTIGNQTHKLCGLVVWFLESVETAGLYEAGIQFDGETIEESAQLVSEICRIVDYQKDIQIEEGRIITLEEAALEIQQGD